MYLHNVGFPFFQVFAKRSLQFRVSKNVDASIEKVKPENYKNYFDYAYGTNKKNRIYKKTINTKI
jgi:hypothetical protein